MVVITMAMESRVTAIGLGPWLPISPLLWVLFWDVLIFVVLRFRRGRRLQRGHSAEDVPTERYARGEIIVEEYRERSSVQEDHAFLKNSAGTK